MEHLARIEFQDETRGIGAAGLRDAQFRVLVEIFQMELWRRGYWPHFNPACHGPHARVTVGAFDRFEGHCVPIYYFQTLGVGDVLIKDFVCLFIAEPRERGLIEVERLTEEADLETGEWIEEWRTVYVESTAEPSPLVWYGAARSEWFSKLIARARAERPPLAPDLKSGGSHGDRKRTAV